MKENVVADSNKSHGMFLHNSRTQKGQLELHQRLFVCWFYGLMFMYYCIQGHESRLLYDANFIHTKIDDSISPGTTNNAMTYECKNVELLWSNVDNIVLRLVLSPIYGLYIIMHTIMNSNIYFMYSKDDTSFLSDDKYTYKNNTVLVKEPLN